MIIVWPSTANAGTEASAAAVARRPNANPLENLMKISSPRLWRTGLLLFLVDHRQDGARLPGAIRIALILQHLVLEVGLLRRAGAVARQDVHDVRIAIRVGAAAEAVLALVLVDLAGQQVRLVGKALVGLDEDLVAPGRRIAAAELFEVDGARDRAAGALDSGRNEVGRLFGRRNFRLDLGSDLAGGLRREDDQPVPAVVVGEGDVGAGRAVLEGTLAGVDGDEHHLYGEPAAHAPRVFHGGVERDVEVHLLAADLDVEAGHVERSALVDAVGRIRVGARPVVVAYRVLERRAALRDRRPRD